MQVGIVHNRSQAAHKRLREASATENIENPNNGIGQELSPPLKINAVSEGSDVQDLVSDNIYNPNNGQIPEQTIPMQPNASKNSILDNALQGVNVVLNYQKTLYIVEHPNKPLTNLEYEMDKKSEWNRIERCCIYVINYMLTEHFEPYHLMQQNEKKIIIKNTATKMLFLLKCYQTSKYFPDPEDNRLVTHYGYYNSPDTNEYFFANEVSQNKEECYKIHNIYLGHLRAITNKLVTYDFGEVDLAALSYLIFALECEKHALYKNIIETNKNLLFDGYLKIIVNTYGFEKAGVKFGNVLSLQNDITELQRQLYEFRIMGKLFFSSDFVDIWDELLFENQETRPIPITISNEHHVDNKC
uniref:NR LBD domain-containing protein n=1 Tax=Acrobeloides nanus TaxID=290746 RepID=A0A914CSK3_9BILA